MKRRAEFDTILLALLLFGLLGTGCGKFDPSAFHGTFLEPPMKARPFRLTSAAGPVELEDFRGRILVLSFGYTSCPLVCPTTMGRLSRATKLLGSAAAEVQVALITVDPAVDTPERLAEYLAKFDDSFVGLSGSREVIADVAAAYGIYHEIPETDEDRADLGHSSQTLVLDREGRMMLVWSYEVTAEDIAADLALLVGRG